METKDIELQKFENLSESIRKTGERLNSSIRNQVKDMKDHANNLKRIAELLNVIGDRMVRPSKVALIQAYRIREALLSSEKTLNPLFKRSL